MELRKLAVTLAAASALTGATAFAQTAVVVEPVVPADRSAPVVVVTPGNNAYVVTPDNLPPGQHYAIDSYGHAIVVDDAYGPVPPERRSMFDSSEDRVTGTVTSPGYMGPRDSSGQ